MKTALAGERVNTLSEVETAQEKSRAGTVAGQVKGVRQVVNLQVIKR
ncbi:MAG: hypothetical protein ACXWYD_10245 [Candidatus Binatia bacterium]